MRCNSVETIDKRRLKMTAHNKPSTWIPGTSFAASNIMMALTISKKSPKVMIVIGRVRITSRGLTMALKKARTRAKTTAVVKELMTTWGFNRRAKMYTATAVRRIFMINRIINILTKAISNYNQFKKIFGDKILICKCPDLFRRYIFNCVY